MDALREAFSGTTVLVKWASNVPDGRYLYHDGRRWVPCDLERVRMFLRNGYPVHMNPVAVPHG